MTVVVEDEKRFVDSRAKEWPARKSKKMQGLCYGCGAPGHIKMDCPRKNAQRSPESSWRWSANLRGGKKTRDRRRGFGNGGRTIWRNFERPFEEGNEAMALLATTAGKSSRVMQMYDEKEVAISL